MYKNTSDKLTYIERVASHSTKEHPNGRIDAVPANAEPPTEYFNTLYKQYNTLFENYKLLTADAAVFRQKLRQRLQRDDYQQTQTQYSRICEQMHHIEEQFAELRPLIRSARNNAADGFRWNMAKTILRADDVRHIENQCSVFLGASLPVHEGMRKRSPGEMQGEAHDKARESSKRRDRRGMARKNMERAEAEGLTMYADSRFKQDEPQKYTLSLPVEYAKKKLADHFNKKRGD